MLHLKFPEIKAEAVVVTLLSGKKEKPKPKLFGPDLRVGWGSSTWRGRVKKFGMSSETQGKQTSWRDISGFWWDIPGAPKSLRKKTFGFNFRTLFWGFLSFFQGRILAVWILAPNLPNFDLKLPWIFGWIFFLRFFPREKACKKSSTKKNPRQNSPGTLFRKIPLGLLQKPFLDIFRPQKKSKERKDGAQSQPGRRNCKFEIRKCRCRKAVGSCKCECEWQWACDRPVLLKENPLNQGCLGRVHTEGVVRHDAFEEGFHWKVIEFFRGGPRGATTLLHFSSAPESRPFIQSVKSTLRSTAWEGFSRLLSRWF